MSANLFRVSNLISRTMTEFFLQKNPLYLTSNHDYDREFEGQNYMTGGSINIKVPGYPAAQRGLAVSATPIQDVVITYTITENDIYSVTRNLNSFETLFNIGGGDKALTTDQEKAVVDNYGYPAFEVLKGDIELEAAARLTRTVFFTPVDSIEKLGAINNYNALSEADQMANDLKFQMERYMVMNTKDARLVSNSLQNYFAQNYALPVLKGAWIGTGDKGNLAGFDVWRSTELRQFTAGTLGVAGTVLTVTSVASDGSSITFSGALSNTNIQIVAGDRISIPAVYLVDPILHEMIGWRLVVTAIEDARGDGAGNITVNVSYPLMASGEHQNVVALPANGNLAYVYPSRNINFAYTRAGLSTVPLMLPPIYGAVNDQSKKNLFPARVVMQGAALDFQNNYRIAVMVGIQAFAPYCLELPSSVN